MNFKDMLAKTGCQVIGICKGVNEYVNKEKKSYWSVDLEVLGTKMPVNVRLPENYDRSKLLDYELVSLKVCIKPSFDKKAIVLEALS